MPNDFRVSITNPRSPRAYPIASFTWLLVDSHSQDKARTKALSDFLSWALTVGQKYCVPLGYAPLPESVAKAEIAALNKLRP